jgi:hypothetical protein
LIAEMKSGARVLIHAGGSGVGIAAIQLAKGFGAKEVFTTAGCVPFYPHPSAAVNLLIHIRLADRKKS